MSKYLLMIRVWSYFESRPHRPVVFSNADIIIKIYKIRSILLCYCDVIITRMCFSSTPKLCVIRDENLIQALFTKHLEVRICKYRVLRHQQYLLYVLIFTRLVLWYKSALTPWFLFFLLSFWIIIDWEIIRAIFVPTYSFTLISHINIKPVIPIWKTFFISRPITIIDRENVVFFEFMRESSFLNQF